MEGLPASSIARFMETSPLVQPQFPNPHLWLEPTHLTYPGYDLIPSK